MKFYCISMKAKAGEPNALEHVGYEFVTSKKAAQAFAASPKNSHLTCDSRLVEVECTKPGILRALNVYAGHPDNG